MTEKEAMDQAKREISAQAEYSQFWYDNAVGCYGHSYMSYAARDLWLGFDKSAREQLCGIFKQAVDKRVQEIMEEAE